MFTCGTLTPSAGPTAVSASSHVQVSMGRRLLPSRSGQSRFPGLLD